MVDVAGAGLELAPGSVDVRAVEIPVLRGDPSRLMAIGWRPEIGLDETLAAVLDDWRSRGPAVGPRA
jgi:hypothetical protein